MTHPNPRMVDRQTFHVMVRRAQEAGDDSDVLESRWVWPAGTADGLPLFELGRRLGQLVRGWAAGSAELTQLSDGFLLGLTGHRDLDADEA